MPAGAIVNGKWVPNPPGAANQTLTFAENKGKPTGPYCRQARPQLYCAMAAVRFLMPRRGGFMGGCTTNRGRRRRRRAGCRNLEDPAPEPVEAKK